ncbi:nuclear transport factor 2 family protein [Kutzneria chonburiensis]|uniref:Nuclear transport factor 2 family protein n=1 Tax=Kutzneria chonburiensis TaxID=1483604 RepID=A0ABV6N0S5_9PSEU|nr:nuclear transport factor 2 family protein [Kutzneria chonburiensis]
MADTPSEVVGQLIECFATGRFADAAELYSDDCVVFAPLAPDGPMLFGGAEARALVKACHTALPVRDLTIRTTPDPEVAIAEWDYVGRNPDTGQDVVTGNLLIVRVRDGRIVSERPYLDHVTRAFITGGLNPLLEALNG